ncbi:MAG: hypothetical protein K2X27_27845 [Candidatus Obscuribacterales bacterium]|nr:hypothetical protein [Candidatus Obscuribacterales bacterium]
MNSKKKLSELSFRKIIGAAAYACFFTFAIPHIAGAYSLQFNSPTAAQSTALNGVNTAGELPRNIFGAILSDTRQDRQKLLWSMYPASVRGRVFGSSGGDPISSGGW